MAENLLIANHGPTLDGKYCRLPRCGRPWPCEVARLQTALKGAEQGRVGSLDRDFLGRLVRSAWVAWAKEQPNVKSSWLLPWDELDEAQREVDRRIGEAVVAVCVSPELLRVEQDRDGYKARDRLRGKALKAIRQRASRGPSFLHPTKEFAADVVRLAEPAIDITLDEAREKEGR